MDKISGTTECQACRELFGYIINAELIHTKILSFEAICPHCGQKEIRDNK